MKVENDKIKKVIESNVSINYLNKKFIQRREESIRLQYRTKLLSVVLNKQLFKTAKEIRHLFEECIKANESNNVDF